MVCKVLSVAAIFRQRSLTMNKLPIFEITMLRRKDGMKLAQADLPLAGEVVQCESNFGEIYTFADALVVGSIQPGSE